MPGVRLLVGTRSSTHETPDAPAADTNLLDALTITSPPPARPSGSEPVWVARDAEAICRYVTQRLRHARDYGRRGVAVPDLGRVSDADIDRVAATVAGPEREFLYARLAVYELIEEPRLLTEQRTRSLATLLEGDHQDLFAKALDRLARLNDRYPLLLRALALARGRGLPEADGIWAIIAAALPHPGTAPWPNSPTLPTPGTPQRLAHRQTLAGREPSTSCSPPQPPTSSSTPPAATPTTSIPRRDVDSHRATAPREPAGQDQTEVRQGTVYRLAHRTFVEYFTTHPRHPGTLDHDRTRAATALLRSAIRIAAVDPAAMPAYLAQHLSGHAADAEQWDTLAVHPRVLDGLDPHAVTADALRTLFGRRPMPPPVAGVVGARDALTDANPAHRAGLRQLATTTHSARQVVDEPANGWGIAAAQAGRVTMHVQLTGHTGSVAKVRCLTLPDQGTILASASDDGTIRLWDPATATPLGTPLPRYSPDRAHQHRGRPHFPHQPRRADSAGHHRGGWHGADLGPPHRPPSR
ncbi:MAG: WD40 repeat domain-containing protein [Pseudonocardiaceae bacterium]